MDKVYGEQNLFEMKNKVARNRFLIISYSTESRIVEELSRNKKIFLVNAGQKLEETEREGLQLDWRKKPSTATVISLLNLVITIIVNILMLGVSSSSSYFVYSHHPHTWCILIILILGVSSSSSYLVYPHHPHTWYILIILMLGVSSTSSYLVYSHHPHT